MIKERRVLARTFFHTINLVSLSFLLLADTMLLQTQ